MNHDRDIDTQDIDWMAAQQPQRVGSDPFVTSDPFARERALQALEGHMDQGPRRRFGLRRLLGVRTLGFAAGGGAAALVAVALLSSGGGGTPAGGPSGGAAAIAPNGGGEAAGPLMQLASYVSDSPEPTGNATLVQRTKTYDGGETETSYELFGDEGPYLWSPTKEGVTEMIEGRPAALNAGEVDEYGITARELAAAEEANSGDVRAAAEKMAAATGHPSERFGPGDPLYPNRVWEWSQQAIIAGAGRPEIRAGVLKMLDTLPGMKITEGVEAGSPTLVLTSGPAETPAPAADPGDGYTEQLTLDARTGEPIKFVGGPTGGGPGTVTIDYKVSREQYAGLSSVADATE